MGVTHIQCGVTNHRNNRAPLDAESVMFSYTDLLNHVQKEGQAGTKEGAFYAGLFTSVINDEDEDKNGPYFISYDVHNDEVSYTAERLVNSYEMDTLVDTVCFGWGHL